MPTYTTFIRAVYPVKCRSGDRFEVVLPLAIPYTWDAMKASLCQRASTINRAATITTRQTTWGEEIVTVDLVPEQSQEVA